jgi:hypothetical protein
MKASANGSFQSRGAVLTRTTAARLSDAGFEPRVVPFNHSELEPGHYGVFVAVRPA